MPSGVIQWYPGHMAKTKKIIRECLPDVDIIIEILDARIPKSSRNPDLYKIIGTKPLLTVLNKASLADPAVTEKWTLKMTGEEHGCIVTDCVSGDGMTAVMPKIKRILSEKVQRYEERGMSGRALRAMIVGIPNCGKSSFINYLAHGKKTKVEDRPGVTREKQWIPTSIGLHLLDMPGVLWPKFDDRHIAENLALTGAIRDAVLDIEELGIILCSRLRKLYPQQLAQRYKLELETVESDITDNELFELIGKKRGFIISGGLINTERTAAILLDEFRSCKIGRISLDIC